MAKKDNKIVRSYSLLPETIQTIKAYSEYIGDSDSAALDELVARGMENTKQVELLTRTITSELDKIKQQNQKNTDRIVNVLIGIARVIGKILAHTFVTTKTITGKTDDEIFQLEKYGISKSINELKWREKGVRYEE